MTNYEEPETRDEKIKAVQAIADHHKCEIRKNYSGRGMFGKKCYGVVGPRKYIMMEAGRQGLPEPETDQMGLRTIAYWPSIKGEGAC